ncbi:MAG: hypothetical protein AAF367_15165 [Pseudomonadota bacterium]
MKVVFAIALTVVALATTAALTPVGTTSPDTSITTASLSVNVQG